MVPTVMCVCLRSSSQDGFTVCPLGCVCKEVRLVGLQFIKGTGSSRGQSHCGLREWTPSSSHTWLMGELGRASSQQGSPFWDFLKKPSVMVLYRLKRRPMGRAVHLSLSLAV